jgi:hypothetical protein
LSSDVNYATGNVYVFNVFNESLNVATNGLDIGSGSIDGWASRSDKNPYRPFSASVRRVFNANAAQGSFFNGNNILTLSWPDVQFTASVKVSGPLNQDLLLFIHRDSWRLVDQYGGDVCAGRVSRVEALQ